MQIVVDALLELLGRAGEIGVVDAQQHLRRPDAARTANSCSAVRTLPTWSRPVGEGAKRRRMDMSGIRAFWSGWVMRCTPARCPVGRHRRSRAALNPLPARGGGRGRGESRPAPALAPWELLSVAFRRPPTPCLAARGSYSSARGALTTSIVALGSSSRETCHGDQDARNSAEEPPRRHAQAVEFRAGRRSTLPEPGTGEVLVRNLWMSVDPYMRGRMNDRPSYVPPFQIGEAHARRRRRAAW